MPEQRQQQPKNPEVSLALVTGQIRTEVLNMIQDLKENQKNLSPRIEVLKTNLQVKLAEIKKMALDEYGEEYPDELLRLMTKDAITEVVESYPRGSVDSSIGFDLMARLGYLKSEQKPLDMNLGTGDQKGIDDLREGLV